MNTNIKLIIIIVFLSISAFVCACLFYQRQLDLDHLSLKIASADTQALINDYSNEATKESQKKLDELAKGIEKSTAEKDELTAKLTTANDQLTLVNLQLAKLKEMAQNSDKRAEDQTALVEQFKAQIAELQKNVDASLKKQVEDLELEVQNERKKSDTLKANLNTEIEKGQLITKQSRLSKTEAEQIIEQLRHQLNQKEMTKSRQESLTKKTDHDGQVVECDVDRRFAVINLGKVNRVYEGMRFDVVRWRLNKWDLIAAVELTEVKDGISNAVILDEVRQQISCPRCGFIATQGMKQCPFCTQGESHNEVVFLAGGGLVEKPGMKRYDPILKGDFIVNPLYNKDRVYTFTLAGEPAQFSSEELKTQITRYGAKIKDEISTDTDFLILCTIPEKKEAEQNKDTNPQHYQAYLKAVDAKEQAERYGIPIMREIDLLNFLTK